jgi:hypothetical protein
MLFIVFSVFLGKFLPRDGASHAGATFWFFQGVADSTCQGDFLNLSFKTVHCQKLFQYTGVQREAVRREPWLKRI